MRTKKKTAFGVAAAGAAAVAITGGTFATFSDSDDGSVSADAGSVVLDIGGAYQDGFHISNIAPGDEGCWDTTFTNNGTEKAQLSLDEFTLTDNENGRNDPEIDAGDNSGSTGELSNYLQVKFEGDEIPGMNYTDLSTVVNGAGNDYVTPTVEPDTSYTLTTCAQFVSGGTGDENDAQTDGVNVGWTVTLEQVL